MKSKLQKEVNAKFERERVFVWKIDIPKVDATILKQSETKKQWDGSPSKSEK